MGFGTNVTRHKCGRMSKKKKPIHWFKLKIWNWLDFAVEANFISVSYRKLIWRICRACQWLAWKFHFSKWVNSNMHDKPLKKLIHVRQVWHTYKYIQDLLLWYYYLLHFKWKVSFNIWKSRIVFNFSICTKTLRLCTSDGPSIYVWTNTPPNLWSCDNNALAFGTS